MYKLLIVDDDSKIESHLVFSSMKAATLQSRPHQRRRLIYQRNRVCSGAIRYQTPE